MMRTRRGVLRLGPPTVLAAPALLGPACASKEAPPAPLAPISYTYLTPLPLQVAALDIEPGDPPVVPGDVGATLAPPRPAEAVRMMARDRLSAVGQDGRAVFRVTRASLTRAGAGLGCALGCRLEVAGAEGSGRQGFAEAEARAGVTGADASRPQAAERLLRTALERLNVEFEFQLRRNLRAWLVNVPPGGRGALPAPAPDAVTREDLPRS